VDDSNKPARVQCIWNDADEDLEWLKETDIWVLESRREEKVAAINSTAVDAGEFPRKPSLLSLITIPELAMDVSKWVAYDLLSPDSTTQPTLQVLEVAKYGILSGVVGNAFFEVLKGNQFNESTIARFAKSGLEGGALFVAYEGSIDFIEANKDIRKLLGDKLPFIPYI